MWIEERDQNQIEWAIGELVTDHLAHTLVAAPQVEPAAIHQVVIGRDPVGAVVVAADRRHDRARAEKATHRVVEQLDRRGRRNGAVVEIARDDHQVRASRSATSSTNQSAKLCWSVSSDTGPNCRPRCQSLVWMIFTGFPSGLVLVHPLGASQDPWARPYRWRVTCHDVAGARSFTAADGSSVSPGVGPSRGMAKALLTRYRFILHDRPQSDTLADHADPASVEHAVGRLTTELTRMRVELDESIRLATHDALTGLPNRRTITERLAEAIDRSTSGAVAAMFVDIDRFKVINDLYGHEVGDRVLCEVGERLRDAVGDAGEVGRLGGDEFVVVVRGATGERLSGIAARVLECVGPTVDVGLRVLPLTVSVGVAPVMAACGAADLLSRGCCDVPRQAGRQGFGGPLRRGHGTRPARTRRAGT